MARFILRRLTLIPLALLGVNFIAFSFSHLAIYFHQLQNPFGSLGIQPVPIFSLYKSYLINSAHLDFGIMPDSTKAPMGQAIIKAAGNSLGLLAAAFLLSTMIGLLIGLRAVRNEPAIASPWLVPISAIGMAMPSFYLGTLFILAGVYYSISGGPDAKPLVPIQGFGWDAHLILPVLALMVRPTVQIAQLASEFLSGELGKQYVVAARSHGNSWNTVRWKHALRNVLAPIILAVTSSFRLLIGELILVEWLFAWPGLGRLLTFSLIPPNVATVAGLSGGTQYFLNPELITAVLTVFTLIFLIVDTLASISVRLVDPRLRATETEVGNV
jgi:ABC-type dipeptide/oligopeptide/nickel transport system permease component